MNSEMGLLLPSRDEINGMLYDPMGSVSLPDVSFSVPKS